MRGTERAATPAAGQTRRSPRIVPRLLGVVAATVTAAGLLVAPAAVAPHAVPSVAAASGLSVVGDARYVVDPEKRRIVVVVDLTATNRLPETRAGVWYFERASLAVPPGTTGLRVALRGASASSTAPAPRVALTARTSTYGVVSIAFGRRLLSGQSIQLRLRFVLPDPGGSPSRLVRVGPSLVQFPVWAYASSGTSGGSVSVILPPGFTPDVVRGSFERQTSASSGETILSTGRLATPLSFFAYVRAERPTALVPTTLTTTVGDREILLTLRSWPEDADWTTQTGRIFSSALPLLAEAIGLPFDGDGLTIEEASDRATGGYAGLFDPATRTVRVAYDARPAVALHEAAHAWFNGRLLAERWASEGFASYYAAELADDLEIRAPPPALTPALAASRFPLNRWGAVGEATAGTEDYGYAASARLATEIAERAGLPGLVSVWQAAADRESPYQARGGAPVAERTVDGLPPDWRGLLDLLEERIGTPFDDLWREWVVAENELVLLDARAASRATYAALGERAGDWELSPLVRRALEAWRFPEADGLLDVSADALDGRDRVAIAAARVGLEPSDRAREAFEGMGGPATAVARLDDELDALAAIALTESEAATVDEGHPLLVPLGLLGADPALDLARARSAYEAGELGVSLDESSIAYATWAGAEELGRRRLLAGLVALVALGGTAVAFVVSARRRRFSHGIGAAPGRAMARPTGTADRRPGDDRGSELARGYGTLPGTSDGRPTRGGEGPAERD